MCVCLWLKSCVSNPVCTCWHSCTGCQIPAWQPHGPEVCSRRGPSTWWNGQEHFLSRQAACSAKPAAAATAPSAKPAAVALPAEPAAAAAAEVAAAGNTAPPAELAPSAVIVKLFCMKRSWNGMRPKLQRYGNRRPGNKTGEATPKNATNQKGTRGNHREPEGAEPKENQEGTRGNQRGRARFGLFLLPRWFSLVLLPQITM